MAEQDKKKGERGGIQSLERAAALLDAIATARSGASLSDVCGATGLHTSTAFHLLKTLVDLDLIAQDAETKRYVIGRHIFALAAGGMDDNVLLRFGQPILDRLSQVTGESAHLAIRSRKDIVLVARALASGMLQMSERSGLVRPAHATAIGKTLLAHMPPVGRAELLAQLDLRAYTEHTITSPEMLLKELETVARDGIAHDRCEFDADVRCIALPIHDFSGRCCAAIGISGPVWRMTEARLQEATVALEQAASELSAALGYALSAVAE